MTRPQGFFRFASVFAAATAPSETSDVIEYALAVGGGALAGGVGGVAGGL